MNNLDFGSRRVLALFLKTDWIAWRRSLEAIWINLNEWIRLAYDGTLCGCHCARFILKILGTRGAFLKLQNNSLKENPQSTHPNYPLLSITMHHIIAFKLYREHELWRLPKAIEAWSRFFATRLPFMRFKVPSTKAKVETLEDNPTMEWKREVWRHNKKTVADM